MSYRTLFNSTVDVCSIIQGKTYNILITKVLEIAQRFGTLECPIQSNVNKNNFIIIFKVSTKMF